VTVAAMRRLASPVWLAVVSIALAAVGCGGSEESKERPSPVTVAGYVVPWDPPSGPAPGAGVLDEVNPVWFRPTDAGTVEYVSEQARTSAPAITAVGIAVAPSISNFRGGRWDGELVAQLLNDPQRRALHVTAIVELVRSQGWRGIDIDYESLPASSRDAYSAFLAELAGALHGVPARLSVTVHAKTAEPGGWSGAQAQDWRAIGTAADEVRIMAYDFSFADSPPGPIAPVSWVDQVLTLATDKLPRDRIALGLATYGYDWNEAASGVAVQWSDVQETARSRDASPQWDAENASPWLRYTDDQGAEHAVWYEDARSLKKKLELARSHGVSRLFLWRLGGEDPAIWSALRAAR
jgi:spore germination protein